MPFEITLSPDENPIDTVQSTIHAREAILQEDSAAKFAQVQLRAWASRAAYDAGKESVGTLQGVGFGPNPTPAQFDPKTGDVVVPAKPAWEEIKAVFPAEFDYIATIWFELTKRFDPQIFNSGTPVEPLPDPAVLADVQARLDAAGITGLGG